MSLTREQECEKKRRQRARSKSGEWCAWVEVDDTITPVLAGHGLATRLAHRDEVKTAIVLLIDCYATSGGGIELIDKEFVDECWKYRYWRRHANKPRFMRKRLQRQRQRDGDLRLQLLIDDNLIAALTADGFLDEAEKSDRAAVEEALHKALWALANGAAVITLDSPLRTLKRYQSLDSLGVPREGWSTLVQPLRRRLLLARTLRTNSSR